MCMALLPHARTQPLLLGSMMEEASYRQKDGKQKHPIRNSSIRYVYWSHSHEIRSGIPSKGWEFSGSHALLLLEARFCSRPRVTKKVTLLHCLCRWLWAILPKSTDMWVCVCIHLRSLCTCKCMVHPCTSISMQLLYCKCMCKVDMTLVQLRLKNIWAKGRLTLRNQPLLLLAVPGTLTWF